MIKKGFTLAEVLITVGLIGVLAVILMPIVADARPSKEMMMFRKAHYLAEKTIGDLINDEQFYPLPSGNAEDTGFGDTTEITYRGNSRTGASKFCDLFADKYNISGTVDCSAVKDLPNGNFKTSDGIVWSLPVSNFESESNLYPIYVDVNGAEGNNCFFEKDKCKSPDRFVMYFYRDGRLKVLGTAEQAFLKSDRVLPSKKIEDFLKNAKTGSKVETKVDTTALSEGTSLTKKTGN